MLGSSVFGARPHLVLVVAHDRRGPYSALRGLARFVVPRERAPGDREPGRYRVFRERRAASRSGKRKACVGLSGDSTDYPLRLPRSMPPIANANASPSLRSDPRAARASPRTDVQTRACGVKEPQPVDSRRHDADRPDPLDPRRRRANKDTKRIQTETGERRECEKLSRRGGRVGSPGGVWACTCTTPDERRS